MRRFWKRYTICNVESFVELLGDSLEDEEQPSDEDIQDCGFEPDDEELCFCSLTQDWEGHKAGARVIHGLTVEGHSFAIEKTCAETDGKNHFLCDHCKKDIGEARGPVTVGGWYPTSDGGSIEFRWQEVGGVRIPVAVAAHCYDCANKK